jgi:hypothetical protein
MVGQIRVLENIDVTPRHNINRLIHEIEPSKLSPPSSAMSSKAVSPTNSSKTDYSNIFSLSDLFQLVNEKRSQRHHGGPTHGCHGFIQYHPGIFSANMVCFCDAFYVSFAESGEIYIKL